MTITYDKQILIKRGNTAEASTYVGPLGELVLDTDTNRVYVHDGITVGGTLVGDDIGLTYGNANIAVYLPTDPTITSLIANAGAQSAQILAVSANVTTANTNIKGYVDASISSANVGMKTYVDSTISANIAALVDSAPGALDTLNELAAALGDDANLSVTLTNTLSNITANISTLTSNAAVQSGEIANLVSNAGIQYDAISSLQSNAAVQAGLISGLQANVSLYGNSNVASYLTSYSGNISVGNVIFSDLSVQTTAYTGVQWRSNLDSNVTVKPSWLSYVPGGKNQEGTQYGFDAGGMFFTSNADNDFAYPIQTNLHLHETDTVEIIASIYHSATNNDHGLCVFSSGTRPIWKSGVDISRIAFQYSAGIPVLYGQTTANTAPGSPVLVAGNYYTVKFRYDPTNTVTVETFNGNTASGTPIDSRSISEVLPVGDYKIGFDADNDSIGVKSYWTNLTIRTLTNTVVNDLEVQGQITGNLIPSANVTYSLGSPTQQWKDLYLSGNTIFLGAESISTAPGGGLTFSGTVSVPNKTTGVVGLRQFAGTQTWYGPVVNDAPVKDQFGYTTEITVDVTRHAEGNYTVSDVKPGNSLFHLGDTLIVRGTDVYASTPANDLTLQVTRISGEVVNVDVDTAPFLPGDKAKITFYLHDEGSGTITDSLQVSGGTNYASGELSLVSFANSWGSITINVDTVDGAGGIIAWTLVSNTMDLNGSGAGASVTGVSVVSGTPAGMFELTMQLAQAPRLDSQLVVNYSWQNTNPPGPGGTDEITLDSSIWQLTGTTLTLPFDAALLLAGINSSGYASVEERNANGLTVAPVGPFLPNVEVTSDGVYTGTSATYTLTANGSGYVTDIDIDTRGSDLVWIDSDYIYVGDGSTELSLVGVYIIYGEVEGVGSSSVVSANSSPTFTDLTVSGNLTVSGDIYVSPNSLYLGNLKLSTDDGNTLLVNGAPMSGTATNITSADDITITNAVGGSNVADIYIESADDIFVQAKNRTIPGTLEGGDINIYAGDGGIDDTVDGSGGGGDIQIYAGNGGAGNVNSGSTGGFIRIRAGQGGEGSATAPAGSGNYVEISAGTGGADTGGGGAPGGDITITAGDTTDVTQDRGSINLTSGAGGDETTIGGYVQINIPQVGTHPGGSWNFTGAGNVLEVPANAEIFCPNNGSISIVSANNPTNIKVINSFTTTTHIWEFNDDGNLTLPAGGQILDNNGNLYVIPSSGYGNTNVAAYLANYDGTINFTASPAILSTGTVNAVEANLSANITTGGILTDNYYYANGTPISFGGGSTYGNVQVATYLPTYTGTLASSILTVNGNVTANNVTTTGSILAGGKFGYSSGSSVTQTGNRGSGVTINSLSGNIITTTATLAAGAVDAFYVGNNKVDPDTDIVYLQVVSYHNAVYLATALPFTTGTTGFYVFLKNIDSFTTSNEAVTIRFIVIKAPSS